MSPTLITRLRAESGMAQEQMKDLPGVIAGGIRYLAALCAEAADALEERRDAALDVPPKEKS